MPLPPAVVLRKHIHTRSIGIEGWKRDDNLRDPEARLTAIKDHDYPLVIPFPLDHCRALNSGSETVRRYYRRW